MAKHRTHRTHGIAFKRQVVQEYLAGETLHGLARRHDLSRTLIRIWVEKYEAGAFDEDAAAAEHDPGIRGPDRGARAPGRQAGPGARVPKGGSAARTAAEKRAHVRHHRPRRPLRRRRMPTDGDRALHLLPRAQRLCRRHRPGRGHARDQGRVRSLWLAPHAGGAQASGLGREPQEDQAPDTRARLASAAPAPLRRHHRQRSRRAHLPGPLQGEPCRWTEPALGRRFDLHRHPRRLRLPGRDHGCMVAPHRGLRAQPTDRRAPYPCGALSGNRGPASATRVRPSLGQGLANTPPRPTGPCSPSTD